jgi:hypothetical protein
VPEKNFDPDERFSLYPMEGEEVVKKLLDPEKDESADEDDEQGEDA